MSSGAEVKLGANKTAKAVKREVADRDDGQGLSPIHRWLFRVSGSPDYRRIFLPDAFDPL